MIVELRQQILDEIRRIAACDGKPPGRKAFEHATGITQGQWSGRIWARWADALREAGFEPNNLQQRLDSRQVLDAVISACRHFGRLPSSAELKLYRRERPGPPSFGAIQGHFPRRADLLSALRRRCEGDPACHDIRSLLPPVEVGDVESDVRTTTRKADGHVYLLRSGQHYKIGRSDQLERRIKEIRIALPEATVLVHKIATDDPAGIEAYWHNRFSDRRLNGEWFRLSASDVAAFRKRRFQ